jgi:protein O-GlcNAc transferase
MGIRETTAHTIDDYVAIAAGLGRSATERAAMGARIAAGKHHVYGDRACITALETFFDHAARHAAAKP